MKRDFIIIVITAFFRLMFAYAAVSQLLHHAVFSLHIAQFPVLGSFAVVVSWLVPATELFVVIMLCSRRWRFAGLFACFSLLLFSTWNISLSIFLSDYMPCNCAGILSSMSRNQRLVYDCTCVLLASVAVLLYRPALHTMKVRETPHHWETG